MATDAQIERFFELRGDKLLSDIEKTIDSLPDTDPDKEVFYDIFIDEFFGVYTVGYIEYDLQHTILNNEAREMFERYYRRRKDQGYFFIEAFKALLENDEKKCLLCLKKHFAHEAYAEKLFDEVDFCICVFDPFKNAFPDFYKQVHKILRGINATGMVKMLCEKMDEFYASEDPDRRVEAMYTVVQKYPDSIVANTLLGYSYYMESRWGNAIACFEKVEKKPFFGLFFDSDIYFFEGWAYSKLKEYKNAVISYEKALESEPSMAFALNNLGYEYYMLKQYPKALSIFESCLKEKRDLKLAPNNYVRTLLALGKIKEAKAFINKKEYKVAAAIERKVESASKRNEPIKQITVPETDAVSDEAIEKITKKIAGGQQFSSEKLLEDELAMRIDAGIPVFGLKLKIYRRHGEYGRQYIIPIGRLDLLAEDSEGNLYIIELKKDSGYDDPYKQTAEYVDWFEKNHKTKKKIFGIICLNNPTEKVIKAVKKDPRIRLFNYAISYNEIL